MRVVNCRLDDDIADELRQLARNEGKSQYNFIADLLTQHVRNTSSAKEERLAAIELNIAAQAKNIRVVAEVVIALLAAQVGEEKADEILQSITSGTVGG